MDKSNKIVKANVLIEATYRLSLNEQRILLAFISKLDSRVDAPPPPENFTLHASEFAAMFELDPHLAYEAMRDGAETLFNRAVVVDNPYAARPEVSRLRTRWISSIEYVVQLGAIELSFATKILPYLTQLAREFTIYLLPSVAKMTSVHAVRLYELLVQWRGTGSREIEIGWIRERFGLTGQYQGIDDLKKRVITPAVKQINDHSDLWVKWTQKKRGRTVVALVFTFGTKEDRKPAKKPIVDQRGWIEKNARPGESWEQARDRFYRENKK